MLENPPPRASLPSKPGKLPYVFELWPAVGLPPKPIGQLGSQYVTGAAWAWAVRPPRQSAANTNAKANLPAKMGIRVPPSVLKLYPPDIRISRTPGLRPDLPIEGRSCRWLRP